MQSYPAANVYRLIEPGPVLLLTTFHEGRANVMTHCFNMMLQHESPTLLACMIGPWDFSFKALQETGECVLALPGVDLIETTVDIGNHSGADVDKFVEYNLTRLPATRVKAPLIAECLANIECRVVDTTMVEKYNLFVVEAIDAHINPDRKEQRAFHHCGDGTFTVDGKVVDLHSRMKKWWKRAI